MAEADKGRLELAEIPARIGTAGLPSWFGRVAKQARSLLQLPKDWDSYGGKEIDEASVMRGLDILAVIVEPGTAEPSVVPAGHGGLQFEWHRSGIDLEIEVLPPDRLSVYCHDHVSGDEWETDEPNEKLTLTLRRLSG